MSRHIVVCDLHRNRRRPVPADTTPGVARCDAEPPVIHLLLDLLLGRKCGLCRTRYRYLISHETYAHHPLEWTQLRERGNR